MSESDRTANELLNAKRNVEQVKKDFEDGKATVQDLKTAETRVRRAATSRYKYLQETLCDAD